MRRTRARLLACAIVLAAAGVAYASLGFVVTNQTAASNPSIPDGSAGRIVFSVRNPYGNGSAQITGFTAQGGPPVNTTAGCTGVTIAPLTGGFPVMLAGGSQAQFVATGSFPQQFIDTQFVCIWNIDTNPLTTPPADTVTTSFNTAVSPLTPLDVQPQAMRFVVNGASEQQQLVITNYQAAMNVDLTITGDDLTNYFSFTNGPCTGHTCSMQSVPGNIGSAAWWIQCAPGMSSPVTAVLAVTDTTNGTSLGSAQLDCLAAGSGMMGATIDIVELTIPITGTQGMQSFASGTVTTTDTGQLGSATIQSLDPSLKLSYCGQATCTWPPQPLMPSYPLTVECVPGATQTTGTLTVFEAGGSATDFATVTCTGSGGAPMLSVTPGMLAFSTVPANTTSAPQQIHLANTGGSQLDNVLIDFGTSVNASQWRASACTAATGACRFAPGAGSDVDITFDPTSIGAKDVTLTVTSSNGGSDTVSLTGTGTGGIMSVTAPPGPSYILDIGTIPRGQPFSRNIVLANTGNALYTATTTTPTAPYTIAPGPFSVLAGSTTDIAVTCQSATATPTDNAQTIMITSADAYAGGSAMVEVRCKIADTLVQITPTTFDYGEVRINTQPEPVIDIALANPASSAGDAQVTAFALRQNTPGLRLVTPALPFTIAPGTQASAQLQLLTGSDTDLAGEYLDLTIDGTPLAFPVTGKVVTPHSRLVPTDKLDLGTACVGTQVSGSVMLINDGTATLAAEAPVMNQSFIASAPGTPTSLAPMRSLTATVTPAVSAMGNVTGLLTWSDDAPSMHMLDVTLDYVTSGTALSPRGLDFGSVPAGMTGDPQHIKLQNCDLAPATIKIESLKTKQGTLGAWIVEPRVGFSKQLTAKEEQAITVSFEPPARGRYEAELTVLTQAGRQVIHLVGDATGKDWDNTSFYACACNGPGAPSRGWPVLAAIAFVTARRRRGSSLPR